MSSNIKKFRNKKTKEKRKGEAMGWRREKLEKERKTGEKARKKGNLEKKKKEGSGWEEIERNQE